jgi:hypothetical protein
MRSLAAALLAATVVVSPARAGGIDDVADNAQAALQSGLALLRKVLHVGKQDGIVSHAIAVSRSEATLELELADGRTRSLSLKGGEVLVDGLRTGRYERGGTLDAAWRRLLADAAGQPTPRVVSALRAWQVRGLRGDDAVAKGKLDAALADLQADAARRPSLVAAAESVTVRTGTATAATLRLEDLETLAQLHAQLGALDETGAEVAEVVRTTPLHLGGARVAAGERLDGHLVVFRGNADVYGEVVGDVVSLFGDVTYHRGGRIGGSAVAIGGAVHDDGGTVGGDIKTISEAELRGEAEAVQAEVAAPSAFDRLFADVRNLLAMFVGLAMLGFGSVFFGRRYLEVVSDTAGHSFGRSLVVGLLGQLLLLPTLAMLIVGLVFTLVGILLLPFAVVAYALAAVFAFVGGYLAVAHAIGEQFTRRRMARGAFVRAPNAYGYLFTGLLGLMGLWALAALTGWMGPVVIVLKVAAGIITWLAATVGFGAVLLARGGLRETFAGRHIGEMSDEYLWATPPATPSAARTSRG